MVRHGEPGGGGRLLLAICAGLYGKAPPKASRFFVLEVCLKGREIFFDNNTSLLTGCGRKIKIVRDFGGKLCGKKGRLCGELCGIA